MFDGMFGNPAESFNYQLSFFALKGLFFFGKFSMDEMYGNEELVQKFYVGGSVILLMKKGMKPDKAYLELPVHFVEKEDRRGFILELPTPKYECECNYLAFLEKNDGTKLYYTSEYYSMSGEFMLCSNTPDGHASHSVKITCLEDMINAI